MPGIGRYPCAACHYVAANRRMLARHAVLIHSEKVFKCPVCPFITRYAANWYRHKRDLHGLTKVTHCEVCGFIANSTPELAAHKETEHPEHLQIGKFEDKYAREKLRLSGGGLCEDSKECTGNSSKDNQDSGCSKDKSCGGLKDSKRSSEASNYIRSLGGTKDNKKSSGSLQVNKSFGGSGGLKGNRPSEELKDSKSFSDSKDVKNSAGLKDIKDLVDNKRSGGSKDIRSSVGSEDNVLKKEKLKVIDGTKDSAGEEGERPVDTEEQEDIEDDPAFFEPITVIEEFGEEQSSVFDDLNSLVADYDEDENEEERLDESITFSLPLNGHLNGDEFGPTNEKEKKNSEPGSSPDNLGPLKVKRSYNCLQCGLLTSNPREYLYHLKNNHGEKISVFECKYCIYASKHIQKLHRHCNLVHRLLIAQDTEYQKQLQESKEKRAKPAMNKLAAALQAGAKNQEMLINPENGSPSSKPSTRSRNQSMLKCSACAYQTRNRAFLQHHEKTVHLKKRFYRCLQCGYTTSERGRYTKHIKYHSLPKMQCEFCFFRTAYKWNMERHMRNHEAGAEGAFRCDSCNFTTSTKQSFKSHVTNHHNSTPPEEDNFVEEEELSLTPEEDNPVDDSAEWEDMGEPEESEDSFAIPDENAATNESNGDDVPENDTSEVTWKDGKAYQKVLQCKLCDFKAAWPFEMKKHEENHRSQKKHECPLCGMRFEHIAWLTKHLRRVHQENSQAKNIAAAFELMKPTRRRPGKEYAVDNVLPIFQDVLKHKAAANKAPVEPPKNSMLSTLLNKPLQPFVPSSLSKYNQRFKSKAFASATNMSRHLTLGNYSSGAEVAGNNSKSSKNVPTCNVCGYKTRWISELQRHMRVHSQEKPFHCPKCKYHCKWKGDLNRHLMKYHGIKVPSSTKKTSLAQVPKLKLKKSLNDVDLPNDWQVKRSLFPSNQQQRNQTDEGPLDLTVKDTFPNPYGSSSYDDPYEFSNRREEVPHHATRLKSPLQSLRESTFSEPPPKEMPPNPAPVVASASTKRKYQCPFCTFATTTASRFHVHIVQHYNRRPFCCSVCEYNSNWEWDITKHIKLKNCRDKFLNKACVLLTDESGRRNYEKYEKYLVNINAPPPVIPAAKLPGVSVSVTSDVNSQHNVNRVVEPKETKPARTSESPSKNCSYDFRNIGSNFEDTPENIVVTPDINIPEIPDGTDSSNAYYTNIPEGYDEKTTTEAKSFYCKHCNFKHATKRVVISHLSVHAGIKPFRCRACGIASNWRHVIVRHVKDAHNGYMDEVEDRITYAQEGFAISLTSIHQGNSINQQSSLERPKSFAPEYGCKICPYKCDKEFYIKFHMRQHRPREGAVYRCEFCPYFVKFKKTLIRHTKLHVMPSNTAMEDTLDLDEDMDDASEESQVLIPDRYELYQPTEPAEESITISFDQLNQFSFSDPVSPPKIKRHICEQCPYKTDNKTQYLYHKQFHRPNASAPFKCTVCSYWATMQHLLTQHMKVHSGSESQQTPREGTEGTPDKQEMGMIPDKTSAYSPVDDDWADKMTVVYVKREGEVVKMFKCNFCPMMNKKKANVRVHQKMHGVIVNDGKFACSYCDYQCLNQGGLTNHLKIHQKTPEKEIRDQNGQVLEQTRRKFFSYFCQKCPALFKSSNDLEIHSRFHGSGMQFGCTVCDYRTKAKTHLVKHLQVHSPEYMAKRDAAHGPASGTDSLLSNETWKSGPATEIPLVKKIDQMLLLEASETSVALKKTGEAASVLQKCVFCPAPFFKTSTLAYHISLHGSGGEYRCGQCDYAVSRLANITAHALVHPNNKKARNILDSWKVAKAPAKPRKPPLKTFPCPKCPAVFYKQDRFDRHAELHGKNYKYGCQHCDYSVRFAANLIKHRNLHAAKFAEVENASSPLKVSLTPEQAAVSPLQEANTASHFLPPPEPDEKKTVFICDRCPYVQHRKDAVQAHQRRHWQGDGFRCPYCDYTSMQNGFLQSHIKLHIHPGGLLPPQAFMKFEAFQIFMREGEDQEEKLLFDDQEMVARNEEEVDIPNEDNHKKRKHKAEEGSRKKKLPSYDALGSSENSNLPKVPVVVLSDVFANKELMKKLKIPKLKLTKTEKKKYSKLNISYDSESKLQSTSPKPSLVVKISKIENSSNEYSVCTKTSEPSPPVVPKDLDVFDADQDYSKPVDSEKLDSIDDSSCNEPNSEIKEESTELKPVPTAENKELLKVDITVSSDIVPETDNVVNSCQQVVQDEDVANGESLVNGLSEEIL